MTFRGPGQVCYGRNPILELLKSRSQTVEEVAITSEGRGASLQKLLALARHSGVKVSYRTRDQLTAIAGSPHHQGVVARVAEVAYSDLEDLLALSAARGEEAFLLALDKVQDPRNFGAVLRTAEAVGAHGVIIPKHRSVGLTGGAAKAAAGAAALLPVARQTNLVSALNRLKDRGVWIVGTLPGGGLLPWEVDLSAPVCLVLGGEGPGISPLAARVCDLLVSIPMRGRVGSLNVSAAAAVLCYEVVRQRKKVREKSLDC